MKSLIVVVAMARIAHADTLLHGTLVDHATKQPVSGAVITVGSELGSP